MQFSVLYLTGDSSHINCYRKAKQHSESLYLQNPRYFYDISDEKRLPKKFLSQHSGVKMFEFIPLLVELDLCTCEGVLRDNFVMNKLKEQDPIIAIAGSFCGSLISEYLKIPHIVLHTAIFTITAPLLMVPLPPSYMPVAQSGFTDKMTFIERAQNMVYMHMAGADVLLRFVFCPMFNSFQKKHNMLPDKGADELFGMAEMHIVQSDFATALAHPLMPSKYV